MNNIKCSICGADLIVEHSASGNTKIQIHSDDDYSILSICDDGGLFISCSENDTHKISEEMMELASEYYNNRF